jgi:hypothetical protein
MGTFKNGSRRNYQSFLRPQLSSNKKQSEKIGTTYNYRKKDKSYMRVYQLSSDGTILRNWDSIYQISEVFGVYPSQIKYYIENQKIVSGCLFIMMMEYKSTTDYSILYKYLKYKQNN